MNLFNDLQTKNVENFISHYRSYTEKTEAAALVEVAFVPFVDDLVASCLGVDGYDPLLAAGVDVVD